MQIKELFESLPSVKEFDASKLNSDDLIALLRMTGYNDTETEDSLSEAEAEGYFAYAGYTANKSHKYVYAWMDREEEPPVWQIAALFVDLERNGKVACDFGGAPLDSFGEDDEEEMKKYFKRIKLAGKV